MYMIIMISKETGFLEKKPHGKLCPETGMDYYLMRERIINNYKMGFCSECGAPVVKELI